MRYIAAPGRRPLATVTAATAATAAPTRCEAEIRIATWNVHMGVDGWGRPFPVADQAATLDADVLALHECWWPETGGGGRPGTTATAEAVAAALGYSVVTTAVIGRGVLRGPLDSESPRWSPSRRGVRETFHLDTARSRPASRVPGRPEDRGGWGSALLSRLPAEALPTIPLARAPGDPADRRALRATVVADGLPLDVVAVHGAHLRHGSLLTYRALARELAEPGATGDHAVLCGDLNSWGPPVGLAFRGWRRASAGPTWPSWRPHSQIDHVLVRGRVRVTRAEVPRFAGAPTSDHLPVVADLELEA